MLKQLSVIPYYGGKDKMNELIIDNLDYNSTHTYYEIFGGGARTLLNKPLHDKEIYNDLSVGVYTLFKVVSEEDSFKLLIENLYQKEYTKKVFDESLGYRNQYEGDGLREIHRLAKEFIEEMESKYDFHQFDIYRKSGEANFEDTGIRFSKEDTKRAKVMYKKILAVYRKNKIRLNNEISAADKNNKFVNLFSMGLAKDYDEIILAAATYICHLFSRDAIGEVFSSYKFKDNDAFYKRVDKLLDCHFRLRNVTIMQKDAMDFLTNGNKYDMLENSDVMLYCDPTYLPESNDEEDKGNEDKGVKNPGKKYKNFWTKEQHEGFVKAISDERCKCKIMVSNYDSDIYNILDREYGWRRIEFETTTPVGGSQAPRTEVLWLNY
jgi:site-specific DNA-adenine methylase